MKNINVMLGVYRNVAFVKFLGINEELRGDFWCGYLPEKDTVINLQSLLQSHGVIYDYSVESCFVPNMHFDKIYLPGTAAKEDGKVMYIRFNLEEDANEYVNIFGKFINRINSMSIDELTK